MDNDDSTKSRLLVLCIDRDNDIGTLTEIATPISGRDRCIISATRLSLADPEEADANAIFAAIKEHDALQKKGHDCDVAIVTGNFKRGVDGDRKLLREVKQVVEDHKSDGIIFVSDGADDEQLIPIIQGVKPIISVRRITIKHSKSVEESYAVLGRYFRMMVYDPRYSKFFLGVPGLLLIIGGLLMVLDMVTEAIAVSIGILGIAFIIRGFDIDKLIGSLTHLKPLGYLQFFSILSSILIIISSIYFGITKIGTTPEYLELLNEGSIIDNGPYLLGLFIQETINFFWIGLGLFFGGTVLYHWLRRSYKIIRAGTGLLVLLLLYFPMTQISLIFLGRGNPSILISLLLIGLAVIFLAVTIAYQYVSSKKNLE